MPDTRSGFHGVHPMVYAFFDESGVLARKPVVALVEAMIRHGAHGLAVLGLASEVNKLSQPERLALLEWVAVANDKRLPLCVTVAENSVPGQIEFANAAVERGADWLILQPPPVSGIGDQALLTFFSNVIDKLDVPVGIQNAPQYLHIGLSAGGLRELARRHANFRAVKAEMTAVMVEHLVAETEGEIDVFNGRGGFELPDVIRAGAAGVIPGGESFDSFVRSYNAMRAGREDDAERYYQNVLPLVLFLEDGIDHFVSYGKHVAAARLGVEIFGARVPSTQCTPFGLAAARRFASQLGSL